MQQLQNSKKTSSLSKNLSMFHLFNLYFIKTIYGPALSLIFPSVLLIIMGHIMRLEYVFPGIVAFTSMIITVQAMPLGLMEMKNSTLFKYIGASPVSAKSFIAIVIGYYIFINFIAVFLLMFTAMAVFADDVFTGHRSGLFSGIVTLKGFFSFLLANLLHIALGLSIGVAITTFAKTPQQALTFGLLIVFPSMFLSGMVVTVDIIASSKAMQIVSYLMPFKYTTGNIIISATPIGQMGDFLELLKYNSSHNLSLDNYNILFNKYNPTAGVYSGYDAAGRIFYANHELKSTDELLQVFDGLSSKGRLSTLYTESAGTSSSIALVKDKALFDLIFIQSRNAIVVNSNNNLFDIIDSFGVRRVPDIEKIKDFIHDWLEGTKGAGGTVDSSKVGVLGAINAGNYSWMDMFTKQSTTLYKVYDRSLNIFLPMAMVAGLQFYSIKNFKWTSR